MAYCMNRTKCSVMLWKSVINSVILAEWHAKYLSKSLISLLAQRLFTNRRNDVTKNEIDKT